MSKTSWTYILYSNSCYYNSQFQNSGAMDGITPVQIDGKDVPQVSEKMDNGKLTCPREDTPVFNTKTNKTESTKLPQMTMTFPNDADDLKQLVENLNSKSGGGSFSDAGYKVNIWDRDGNPKTPEDRFVLESLSYERFRKMAALKIQIKYPDYKLPELTKPTAPSGPTKQSQTSLDLFSSDTWIAIGKGLIAQIPSVLLTSAVTYAIFKRLHATAQISAEATTRKADAKRDWLGEFGENLNDKVKNYADDPAVGREPIIKDMTKTLTRNVNLDPKQGKGDPNAPALIGEAGVGKTSAVEGLAWRISKNDPAVAALHGYTIISIDLKKVAKGLGKGTIEELPRILDGLIAQAKAQHGKVILYIDEVHRLMDIGKHSKSNQSIAEYFKDVMGRGEILVIVSTTTAEFKEHVEPNAALTRRLKETDVPEPPSWALKIILERKANELSATHGLAIDPNLLSRIPDMAKRYFPRAGANPAASLAMLNELFEYQSMSNEQQTARKNMINQQTLDSFVTDKKGKKIAENISQILGEIHLLNEELVEMGHPDLVITPDNPANADYASIRDLRALKGGLENQIGMIRAQEKMGIVYQPQRSTAGLSKWSDILNSPVDPVALHAAFEATSPELGEHFYQVYSTGEPIQTAGDLLQRMPADVVNRAYENIIASGQTLQQVGPNRSLYMAMTESASSRGISVDRATAKSDAFDQVLKGSTANAKPLTGEAQKRLEDHKDFLKKIREGRK